VHDLIEIKINADVTQMINIGRKSQVIHPNINWDESWCKIGLFIQTRDLCRPTPSEI